MSMGKGAKADNSAVVNEQRAEAAAEAQKEADRQARLKTGLASIKSAFEGSPVMAAKAYDWSNFRAPETMPAAMSAYLAANPKTAAPDFSKTGSVPAGYTAVQVPGRAKTATGATAATGNNLYSLKSATGLPMSRGGMIDPNAGYSPGDVGYNKYSNGAGVGGASGAGGAEWALKDANGKIYYQGDPLTYQADTGQHTGGFDDAFYNKYKQSVLDYYMPQVDKQYKDAKDQATYGLARSGNLRSSAANTLTADLATQNDVNTAGVRNQADTAAGDLRNQVNTEQQKAVSQLYATEDPEVAAQQSLAAVRDISLQQPDMSPLSTLFNVATIGGANVLKGYQGQQQLNTFNAGLQKPHQTFVS